VVAAIIEFKLLVCSWK